MANDIQTTDKLLFTVEQAAQLLSLGRTTIYSLMETGQMRYKRIGRARRIPRSELERFGASGLTGGGAMQPHSQLGGELQTQ